MVSGFKKMECDVDDLFALASLIDQNPPFTKYCNPIVAPIFNAFPLNKVDIDFPTNQPLDLMFPSGFTPSDFSYSVNAHLFSWIYKVVMVLFWLW